jgi:DHA2 family methylenomycin A resistance protein-like MFS transporter
MCTGMFFILLDVTIVNVALPAIRADLNASASEQLWIIDADTLVFACLMLMGGALGDRFGRKRLAVAGLVTFGLGSLGCALASDVTTLIGMRAVQGLGGALLLPQTLAVIAATYPRRDEQARVLGVWAGISSLALPGGPLLGGLLVERFGWEAIFAINVPVCIAATIVTIVVVPRDQPRPERPIDVTGQVFATVAVAALTWACIEIDTRPAGLIAIAACVAVLASLAFLIAERRQRAPLLPRELFTDRTFASANAVGLLMNFGGVGIIFLLTMLIQVTYGKSALTTALWLIPLTAPLALLSPVAGRIAARLGPRRPMVVGMVTAASGMLVLQAVTTEATAWTVVAELLIGVGLALNTAPMVAAVMTSVRPDEHALAGAVNNTGRQIGSAIGLAALGAIAGDPASAAFVDGFRIAAAVGACVWIAAAVIAALGIGRAPEPEIVPHADAAGATVTVTDHASV